MVRRFIGRKWELQLLEKRLERVAASEEGVAVAIRGRRQVGKSRLVQEFCDRAKQPYVYFTATKGASPVEAVSRFVNALKDSSLSRDRELVPDVAAGSWLDAFRLLASALSDEPTIVVLDEMPWLAEQDDIFEGALQTAWDRQLSRHPVLLLLLGSDVHMMERLTAYDRPFFGRADNFALGPLMPAETAQATGLTGADAIDACLVSGGLPGILRSWPHGTPALTFIEAECADPAAPLFSVPESALQAEFPMPDQARRVLETVGGGDRTHANIAAAAGSRHGPLPSGSLSPMLRRLVNEKRVLAMDEPLSTQAGKPALYRVADSNLRLYLGVLQEAQEEGRRGRPDVAFRLVRRRWTSWRGRAVEPLIRESLELAAGDDAFPWPDAEKVGGWWNRQFNPEVDLVGGDRKPIAQQIAFVGSIKWLGAAFDDHDLADLLTSGSKVPGYTPGRTGHVVVSLSGVNARVDTKQIGLVWRAEDVLSAWSTSRP
ncbi:ATP-binding protein [Allorhizocola rhizosphaerae]|uniref:ATP-binding protein n=1 Tax=Allorhizocola rhizosphaerae TaxID=1872709 RepID=UPI000E3DBEC0|nr:ATP-binding protein [Allorhizocola rhizosphaerae]